MKDKNKNQSPSDELGVWNDPELEARLVAMLMGELSPFEEAEMEQELEKSPELRLFRDRMLEVQGLISEVGDEEEGSIQGEDEWKLSPDRRESLLDTFSNKQEVEDPEVNGSAEKQDEELGENKVSSINIQWRSLGGIAACLLLSLGAFIMMFVRRSEVFQIHEEMISYNAVDERDTNDYKYDSNQEVRKPSSPSSSPAKVIAANTPSDIPVPEEITIEPSLDFGNGREFGDGWGGSDLRFNSFSAGETRSGDFGVAADSIDSSLNIPNNENKLELGKQVRVTSKFVDIHQQNNEELGVDWITKPFLEKSSEEKKGTKILDTEIARRELKVVESDKSLLDGRKAYQEKNYEQAVTKYKDALSSLPAGAENDERRASYADHLSDGSIALATQYRRTGKYVEARELIEEVLEENPGNLTAQKHLEYLDDPIRTSPTLSFEHTKDIDKVRKTLYRAKSYYDQAQFDEASLEYQEALRVDPYNKAARRGLESVDRAKMDYYRAAYDQTRAAMLSEVDAAWETTVPLEVKKPTKPSVRRKLKEITVPLIAFEEETTVGDALSFLKQRAKELDTLEADPTEKGLDFVVQSSDFSSGGFLSDDDIDLNDIDLNDINIGALNLQNIPMDEALRQVCQTAGLRYKVEGDTIALMRATAVQDDELHTRTFQVPPDLFNFLGGGGGGSASDDPFADNSTYAGREKTAKELLEMTGIKFREGATAVFGKNRSSIIVRNSANSLDQLEELVADLNSRGNTSLEEDELKVRDEERLNSIKEAKDIRRKQEDIVEDYRTRLYALKNKNDLIKSKLIVSADEQTKFSKAKKDYERELAKLNAIKNAVFTEDLSHELEQKPDKIVKKLTDVSKEIAAAKQTHSTFSLNVSDVSYQLVKTALLEGGEMPQAEKIRVEEFINAFDYGDPSVSSDNGKKVNCVVEQVAHPFYQQRNLMRVGMKTGALGRTQPLRLTILLDNSGSMERADRAATVYRAVETLAAQLGPQDEVTLLSFARNARMVAQKVKGNEAGKLAELVKQIPSEGGTNLSLAIQQAYHTAQQSVQDGTMSRIVLITDGAANLGNSDPELLAQKIEQMRQSGIAFDACGVGGDGLDDEMLEALTRKGDGRYYFIDKAEDADKDFAQKIAGALRPAAQNVKVQVVFNPKRVGNYKLLGFEKHRLEKEDFRNDTVDAAEMAAEEAGNALYQVEAKPNGFGDVGTVFVRFRDMTTGLMVERSWSIPYQPSIKSIHAAKPSMQLATLAGMLGERLRYGEQSSIELKELRPLFGKLRSQFQSDAEVSDLIRMCEKF